MNDNTETQNTEETETDKVFEVAFSFRETLKGICVADSEETVRLGLTEKYQNLPDFTIDKVVELEFPEEVPPSLDDITPTSNTIN